jgi:hypothetical protein
MPTFNKRETIMYRKSTPCGNATIPSLRCTPEAEYIPPCIPRQRITGKDIVLGTITKDHLSYDLVCETKRDLLTIPAKKAFIGMLVTVINEKAVYMLTKAPINMSDSWEKVTFAGGKEVYDAVFAEQKSVPTPAIKISWTFQNNAGSTVEGVNESTDSTNPILERGYKATYSASYSWTNPDSDKYKNPIAASGSWTTLTLDGVESDVISHTITATSSNKSVNVTLSAPKTGLMVSGNKVIPATGNDTASASKSVTFLPRIYYGWSDAIPTGDTAADTIKKLLNKLQNEATFNSPASKPDGTQYYVFAYPKEWGTINKILMDNADPVTTTFSNNNEVKIVNAAGVEHTYYVSVTVAPQKEESFNANVSFSFYFN